MCGTDETNKNRVGENADPSNKAAWVDDFSIPRRGYPIGLRNGNSLSVDDKFDASARNADTYTIRNWSGFLGSPSTGIIHTDMYGKVVIEIALDQAGILMLGQYTGSAGAVSLVSVLNSTNYDFLGDIATSNGGAVAAELAAEAAQYV